MPEQTPCGYCNGTGMIVRKGEEVRCMHCAGIGTVTQQKPHVFEGPTPGDDGSTGE